MRRTPFADRTGKAAAAPNPEVAAELEQWRTIFEVGVANADTLEQQCGLAQPCGVYPFGSPVAVDIAIAEAVWHRLGSLYLANAIRDDSSEPWALRRFGIPRGE